MLKKFIFSLCIGILLTGCQTESAPSQEPEAQVQSSFDKYSTQIFAMDTVMDLSVFAENDDVLEDAAALVTKLEKQLSTTDEDSEIYHLNKERTVSLSDDTATLTARALDLCAETKGALDLSIYPVVRAWGFTTDSYQVPSEEELHALLPYVDYTQIDFSKEDKTISLPEHMEIDLGSIAKGFTGDKLVELFREQGITSALLNLGGNVQALGSKPDGTPWKIGIKDPKGDDYLGVLAISDLAVITSGGYERYFEDEEGNIYWHIIDPETGYPAKNGLISATAVGPEGTYCDALSTSLFIMGPDKAVQFWKDHQDFEMILVTDNGEVLLSSGLEDSFVLTENSPYTMTVISND